MNGFEDDEDEAVLSRALPPSFIFTLTVGVILTAGTQAALDRLIARGWIRLVDLKPSGRGTFEGGLTRVFQVGPSGRQWLEKRRDKRKAQTEAQ